VIKLNKMLMIGSAGANVGKTELACSLIKKFSKETEIVGIKVTTIKDKDGQCPRGGRGCGVCSSIQGNFCITEETNNSTNKDTTRLLSAGASRVFWLRVMKTHLEEAATALLEVMGSDVVSICESNSLRHAVEPAVFLMVKDRSVKTWKESAKQVRRHADKIVTSNGKGFDFSLEQIELDNGKWTLRHQHKTKDRYLDLLAETTAIILAGGKSSRMGVDKAMLLVNGQPMIEKIARQLDGFFSQILISANDVGKYTFLGYDVVPDKIPGQGPLMGIASALEVSSNELNFVVACDIPHIELHYVRKMLAEAKDVDIIVLITDNNKVSQTTDRNTQYAVRNTRFEPLFAVYRRSSLRAINEVLSSGRRKISDTFGHCRTRYIELGKTDWLTNLNTIADYEQFEKQISSEK
jgi:molybdopterin-guanine dinucleotide biosynthesis protein A